MTVWRVSCEKSKFSQEKGRNWQFVERKRVATVFKGFVGEREQEWVRKMKGLFLETQSLLASYFYIELNN